MLSSYFVFTNAALAPFLLLIGVPLILHLFARARPPNHPFSSIEFILQIVRQSVRLKRPQSWLVLVLRTLLFASIIGLFLGPVFFGKSRLAGRFQKKHVVILVDASASMACMEGSQTRFATACGKASEVLSTLSASDAANIIWMRTPSRREFPGLAVNISHLQTVLRKASVSSEAADIQSAMTMATVMLKDPQAAREIYVVSDFQKSAWTGFNPAIPEGINMVCIKIGRGDAPNQALTQLYTRPTQPLLGEAVSIYCEIENFSAESLLRTVYLRAGETRRHQEVRLSPWKKAMVVFKCKFSTPGENIISASLSEDAFPFDNERWTGVNVQEFLRVAILGNEPLTADFWRRALHAVGWARVEMLSKDDLSEKINADVLLLSGWDGRDFTRVREFLQEGGMVIWSPHIQTALSDLIAVSAEKESAVSASSPGQKPLVWQKSKQPYRLKIARPDDPVFTIFDKGIHGDPTRGSIFARLNLAPFDLTTVEPILAYDDGVPALLKGKGSGQLFIWNIPLQPEFSNWASQTEFLPFLSELILNHRTVKERETSGEFMPGQALAREFAQEVLSRDVHLQLGEKKLEAQRMPNARGIVFATTGAASPGDYQWYYHSKLVGHSIVNFPVIESDLRTRSMDELKALRSVAMEDVHSISNLRDGTPLWPWLLALGLLLVLAENAVLLKAERI